ncbi:MAG: hypothetical protein ABIQ93_15210 [Saprospiraceae bacterium]
MPDHAHPAPRSFYGVTISSTFTDLQEHRAALIQAINAHGYYFQKRKPFAPFHKSALFP